MDAPSQASIQAGQSINLKTTASGATACAFTNGGVNAGGSAFVKYENGACTVPQGLKGQAYVSLTNAMPTDNVLTDAITVAGPMVIVPS